MYTIKSNDNKELLPFFTPKTTPNKLGPECLSNFYLRTFKAPSLHEIGIHIFTCNEQYMMYAKAVHFNDIQTAKEIVELQTDKPVQYKRLGRKVKNFNDVEWREVREMYVTDGIMHKFMQNADLKAFLLSTENMVLVEDSPYDTTWGIGITYRDSRFKYPSQWRGQNLLGKCLMKARTIIKNGEKINAT